MSKAIKIVRWFLSAGLYITGYALAAFAAAVACAVVVGASIAAKLLMIAATSAAVVAGGYLTLDYLGCF
jgi:hypothetical protein